ncbi:MAG: hypothetical protein ACR2PW_07985 [Gammaproteobacteria bacterium]
MNVVNAGLRSLRRWFRLHPYWMIWGGVGLVYLVFWSWYTGLSPRLNEQEIRAYMQQMQQANYNQQALDRLEQFMRTDDGGDFIIVNNLHDRDPDFIAANGMTAEQAGQEYIDYMLGEITSRGGAPLFLAEVLGPTFDRAGLKQMVAGYSTVTEPESELDQDLDLWTSVALMRYRSRRDMMDILIQPGFAEQYPNKGASLVKTLAIPVRPVANLADLRLHVAAFLIIVGLLLQLLVVHRRLAGTA